MRGFLEACRITEYLMPEQVDLLNDALDALFERGVQQHPAYVVTREFFEDNPLADRCGDVPVWLEGRDGYCEWICVNPDRYDRGTESGRYRFWNTKPTPEQMEATPWTSEYTPEDEEGDEDGGD